MQQSEMVALIRGGVPGPGGTWADLGAGTGNFSWALAELIGAQGTIYAIDRDAKAIRALHQRIAQAAPGTTIIPQQADLTRPLDLPTLDGVLMANALHFIRDQDAALALVAGYLRPGGRLLLVEYDLRSRLPWVPFPVSLAHLAQLAAAAGFEPPTEIGRRASPSSGTAMFAALATRRA
ncbi:MAG: class I SAM-dependent methyltransferase [Roseiflexaceae bacterium]